MIQPTSKILQALSRDLSQPVISLEVSSPEQLRALVPAAMAGQKESSRFVSLILSGDSILSGSFELENVLWPQVHSHLRAKAVELLSLPADDIELDFQIFSSAQNKRSGIFICMPKKLLKKYLRICDYYQIVPVKMTSRLFAVVESFTSQQESPLEKFGLLDLTREKGIGFAAFDGQQWLLREIPYETADEAKQEVAQSIRSFCAKSSVKDCGPVYLAGDSAVKAELTAQLNGELGLQTRETKISIGSMPGPGNKILISLNLAKYYTFTFRRRKQLLTAINIALAVCALTVLVLGIRIMIKGNLIQKMSLGESHETVSIT